MIVDLIVAAILIISSVIAFLRGFIREILTIFGIVGALAASYFGGPLLTPLFESWLGITDSENPGELFGMVPFTIVAMVLSYTVIFLVVVIALSLLSHFLAESAKSIGLGALDRTLGVVFGLVRGVALLGIVYLLPYSLVEQEKRDSWFADSHSYFYLEQTASVFSGFMPVYQEESEETLKNFEGTMGSVREKMETIDVLKNQGLSANDVEKLNGAVQDAVDGYNQEFRSEMDQLIKDTMTDQDKAIKRLESETTP